MSQVSNLKSESQHHILHMIDFREIVLDGLLHAVFKRHLGVGAGTAGALQFHLHNIVGGKFHKLNISTVLLQVGTDLIYNGFDFLFQCGIFHTLAIDCFGGKGTKK